MKMNQITCSIGLLYCPVCKCIYINTQTNKSLSINNTIEDLARENKFTGHATVSQKSFDDSLNGRLKLAFETLGQFFDSSRKQIFIRKTYLYNFDPLKPHFYTVKLGFTGVYIIFVISAQKHRLWVLVRTASTRRF